MAHLLIFGLLSHLENRECHRVSGAYRVPSLVQIQLHCNQVITIIRILLCLAETPCDTVWAMIVVIYR